MTKTVSSTIKNFLTIESTFSVCHGGNTFLYFMDISLQHTEAKFKRKDTGRVVNAAQSLNDEVATNKTKLLSAEASQRNNYQLRRILVHYIHIISRATTINQLILLHSDNHNKVC